MLKLFQPVEVTLPVPVDTGTLGAAALSVSLTLMEAMVKKDLLTKADVLEIYDAMIDAKARKAFQYNNDVEAEVGILLQGLRQHFDQRF